MSCNSNGTSSSSKPTFFVGDGLNVTNTNGNGGCYTELVSPTCNGRYRALSPGGMAPALLTAPSFQVFRVNCVHELTL